MSWFTVLLGHGVTLLRSGVTGRGVTVLYSMVSRYYSSWCHGVRFIVLRCYGCWYQVFKTVTENPYNLKNKTRKQIQLNT